MAESGESSSVTIQVGPDESKASVRRKVLDYLQGQNLVVDVPHAPWRRIPNFEGSKEAVEKICKLGVFTDAQVVMVNPSKALNEIRLRVLESGKTLLVPMSFPTDHLVRRIIPPANSSPELLGTYSTRLGAEQYGHPIAIGESFSVDLYIVGSVAVSPKGARIGKGGGWSDLKYAMLKSLNHVSQNVKVLTMVHDCQVLDLPDSMFRRHDIPIDYIVTPTKVINCNPSEKPSGIFWRLLDYGKLIQIPALRKIRHILWKRGGANANLNLRGESDSDDILRMEELSCYTLYIPIFELACPYGCRPNDFADDITLRRHNLNSHGIQRMDYHCRLCLEPFDDIRVANQHFREDHPLEFGLHHDTDESL